MDLIYQQLFQRLKYSLVLISFFILCDLGSHYGLCHNEASLGQKDLSISPTKPIINS